jgi:hypothetical protein
VVIKIAGWITAPPKQTVYSLRTVHGRLKAGRGEIKMNSHHMGGMTLSRPKEKSSASDFFPTGMIEVMRFIVQAFRFSTGQE